MVKVKLKEELKMPAQRKLANFEQTAQHYIAEKNEQKPTSVSTNISLDEAIVIEEFAKHLDGFATIDANLRLAGLEATLKVYLEFYDIFKNNAPQEVQEKCMKILQKNHKHTK